MHVGNVRHGKVMAYLSETAIRMTNQQKMLNSAYEAMSPWAQAELCGMAVDMARTWPAKTRALLALVAGRRETNNHGRTIDSQVDQITVVRAGEAVDR